MKLNQFLLAEDPRNNSGGIAIIHTIDPQAIIAIVEGHVQHNMPFRQFTYNGQQGPEDYTLYVHYFFTTRMNAISKEITQQIVDKLLNRGWHWYKSYLEWKDNI